MFVMRKEVSSDHLIVSVIIIVMFDLKRSYHCLGLIMKAMMVSVNSGGVLVVLIISWVSFACLMAEAFPKANFDGF